MRMKINVPWWAKLSVLVIGYNFFPFTLYVNPYAFLGGLNYRQSLRHRTYADVRQKKQEDILVPTEESEAFFKAIEEGNYPIPQYSSLPTDEEIKQHGLHVIGKAEGDSLLE